MRVANEEVKKVSEVPKTWIEKIKTAKVGAIPLPAYLGMAFVILLSRTFSPRNLNYPLYTVLETSHCCSKTTGVY